MKALNNFMNYYLWGFKINYYALENYN